MQARSIAGAVASGLFAGFVLAGCARPGGHARAAGGRPHAAASVASDVRNAPSTTSSSATITRADAERDLALEVIRGTSPIEIGHEADIKVFLVNRSTSRAYAVVLSSDGSDEPGWREPHIWYTVERRNGSGTWEPARYDAQRMCGNFDERWMDDIVELVPGQRVALPWFAFRPGLWRLEDTTDIRVIAHYSYGELVVQRRDVPPALQGMPAYSLASTPLELPLDMPLRLELRVLGPIPRRPGQPLAPVFDVAVVNQWKTALPFSTPEAGGAVLGFEFAYEETPGRVEQAYFSTRPGDSHAAKDQIVPGERRTIVGAPARTGDDWEMSPKARLQRARAVFSVYEYASDRSVHSPWVDIASRGAGVAPPPTASSRRRPRASAESDGGRIRLPSAPH